jgi:tetratricopeptide (TPR) repeat protein
MSSPIAVKTPAPDGVAEAPGFDFLTWIEVNRKAITGGLAAFVVIVLALMVYRWSGERKEAEANHALLAATSPANPAAAKPTVEQLQKIASDYHGTKAAERAELLAADELFKAGKFSEAQSAFGAFLTQFPTSPLAGFAAYGAAASMEAAGQTNQAVDAYKRLAVEYSGEAVAVQGKLGQARLLDAAGQAAQALAIYEEVFRDSAAGALGQLALAGKSEILAKHPELEKAATVTNSVTVKPATKP